ncbi:hypothetical protein [Lysinibacillus telephonicus]|uniref:Uncharacterized protein n=1 Tax=Lysinibacillus telephonicus TaxID=1714840 RepID=A0A3S0I379_9BACI|nr:hypothetical protein [Lysinibacillus telephonicus]RTQ94629.1 hypothetical protein EKG35_05255 [Lysinibacillus telephonicus]
MQNHETKLKKIHYEYDNQEYIVINKCPHCNLDIHPNPESSHSLENGSFKIGVISLSCPSCKKHYFIFNDFGNEVVSSDKYLISIPKYGFNESSLIKNTSSTFQKLYIQSINSEILGYNDIAFFGFIKSLEILLKDIAILEHPESEDEILFCSLTTCLEQFHATNIHLFSKKLLEVLKSDYLHYQKSPDFYVYTELIKDCIDYFLLYLELMLKTITLNDDKKLLDRIKKEH